MLATDNDELIDADNVHEMRVGAFGTVKGGLEAIIFGDAAGTTRGHRRRNVRPKVNRWGDPALVIRFSDWSQLTMHLPCSTTAKDLPFKIGTQVAVKVQCINEDAELAAIAMWELGVGCPVPLCQPI